MPMSEDDDSEPDMKIPVGRRTSSSRASKSAKKTYNEDSESDSDPDLQVGKSKMAGPKSKAEGRVAAGAPNGDLDCDGTAGVKAKKVPFRGFAKAAWGKKNDDGLESGSDISNWYQHI